jgi:hypothetical protein
MKKLVAVSGLGLLLFLMAPARALAEDGQKDDSQYGQKGDFEDEHKRTSALELVGAGLGVPVVIGGVGYLLLRRRVRLGK